MKSFVREKQSELRLVLLVGVLIVALMLAAEATNELAYLLVYALLAIQYARKWWRQSARKRPKALLGADRSKGSR